MGRVLIISEKPSQAVAYSAPFSVNNRNDHSIELNPCDTFPSGAIITWGIGHLVELIEPHEYKDEWKSWDMKHLPIIPKEFKHKPKASVAAHYRKVLKLIENSTVKYIVNGTDPGREGSNIFYSILNMTKAKKTKVKRLWINSLAPDEVKKGFQNLRDNKEDLLMYEEAKTRQMSDWLVGINCSRAYTLGIQNIKPTGGGTVSESFSIGRIQTPTVHLIYQRQLEIQNFVSKPFYEVEGLFNAKAGKYKGKVKFRSESEKETIELLEKHGIGDELEKGVIKNLDVTEKRKLSPRLHSLSSLQSTVNRRWKYSPAQILSISQSLYEKKIISYPRTDSQFITDSEFDYLKDMVVGMQRVIDIKFDPSSLKPKRRFVNNKAVEEHHAIIPTKILPSDKMLGELTEKELNVYKEIVRTTLAMFHSDYLYEETKVTTDVKGLLFETIGNVEKDKGWQALFPKNNTPSSKEDNELPALSIDEVVEGEVLKRKGMTTPPKPYSEGQLINLMRSCGRFLDNPEDMELLKEIEGLGTEATRSGIIETIKKQKYIEVKKNIVSVTKKGALLCDMTKGTLLASPSMTAQWESYLKKIRNGEGSQSTFLQNIEKFVSKVVADIPNQMDELTIDKSLIKKDDSEAIGLCPSCKKGNILSRKNFYGCDNYSNGCKFTISKVILKKNITKTIVKSLCDKQKSNLIKGFKSKKGSLFDAYLKLEGNSIKFEFPKTKR